MNAQTLKKSATWAVLITHVVVYPLSSMAAPGTLANIPLFVSADAQPNIMFLIDNSGSMSNIVPEAPYDPTINYLDCPSAKILPNTATVDVVVSGGPKFKQGSTTYTLGTTGTNKCFDPALTYSARLYAPTGSYLDADYTGNYLNWYFNASNTTPAWTTQQKKPGTLSRMEIAKPASKDLLDSLNNVRVGLATYNNGNGASITTGVADIATNRDSMKTQIDALTPGGNTPLAESLQDIGRYFVQGFNNDLTLYPSPSSWQSKKSPYTIKAYTVFDHVPAYGTGVTAASPIQNFCQKNFAVIMTDGRPQGDQAISSTSGLRDYDLDCDGASPACLTFDRKDGQSYESEGSDYLNDVAKALNDIDLRPDLNDFKGNPVKNNITTYTIGFADDQAINDPLMKSTAKNGGGEFLSAKNSNDLRVAFEKATSSIFQQLGSASAVAFNSSSLNTDSAVYQGRFDTVRWSGELLAYELDDYGNIATTAKWNAATGLKARAPSSRVIISHNGTTGIPFAWSSLSTAQQSDLNRSPTPTVSDTNGSLRLNYLRGDRSRESTQPSTTADPKFRLRNQDTVLGDIVHSSPVYVGKPELRYPDTAAFTDASSVKYATFASSNSGRTPIVYIGANDGMLHGFRADTGAEAMAYIPRSLFSANDNEGLHYLTDQTYQHRFYVDLGPTVSDAIVNGAWKTILVGGLRGGGRGIFALDINDPNSFSSETTAATKVMWEFNNTDDSNLGYTFSKPHIALLNNGKWAAIFGNGYNDTSTAGDGGRAKLFIAYLDGGLDGVWTPGTDYFEIDTEVGTVSDRNGLATPAVVDLDGNGTADRVYAGDLKGNMWAFDLSDTSASSPNWKIAYSGAGAPKPLFTAKIGTTVQPITTKPSVVKHPTVPNNTSGPSNAPNVLVLFGTGQYLVAGDTTTTATQTFYGVWDKGDKERDRSHLVAQTFLTGFSSDARVLSDNPVDYTTNTAKHGWYIDLPTTGERVVVNAKVRGDHVFFNTMTPNTAACSNGGTSWLMAVKLSNGGRPNDAVFDFNNDNKVDNIAGNDTLAATVTTTVVTSATTITTTTTVGGVTTTTVTSNPSGVAAPTTTTTTSTGIAVSGMKQDAIASESTFLGSNQYNADSEGKINKRAINPGKKPNEGRLSWREIRR